MATTPERIALGRIGRSHGVTGAFRVWPYADDFERFTRLRQVVLTRGNKTLAAVVRSVQILPDCVLIQTEEVTRPEDVATWLGGDLEIAAEERAKPPDGEFFHDQIIGLRVETTDGQLVGTITGIIEAPASDVYVCRDGDREFLIPAVDVFIQSIDPAGGRMVIAPIPGMVD
ncbi:MAG: ribosome maturation factor RimM [Candidatus Zixiibacteriota bacterium]